MDTSDGEQDPKNSPVDPDYKLPTDNPQPSSQDKLTPLQQLQKACQMISNLGYERMKYKAMSQTEIPLFNGTLLPHQIPTAALGIACHDFPQRCGSLIALDMGLGETAISLFIIAHLSHKKLTEKQKY